MFLQVLPEHITAVATELLTAHTISQAQVTSLTPTITQILPPGLDVASLQGVALSNIHGLNAVAVATQHNFEMVRAAEAKAEQSLLYVAADMESAADLFVI